MLQPAYVSLKLLRLLFRFLAESVTFSSIFCFFAVFLNPVGYISPKLCHFCSDFWQKVLFFCPVISFWLDSFLQPPARLHFSKIAWFSAYIFDRKCYFLLQFLAFGLITFSSQATFLQTRFARFALLLGSADTKSRTSLSTKVCCSLGKDKKLVFD